MHPELEYQATRAHFADLRREADLHRERRRLIARGRRRAVAKPSTVLAPGIRKVLVFAERPPTEGQLTQALEQLKGLTGDVVTALVHHRPVQELVNAIEGNEAGTHSLTLPTSGPRIPAQRQPSEAETMLSGVVDAFRTAGHEANGELVAGSLARVLVDEVRLRRPEAVILLTDRHRFARLAHRDLERRLRSTTSVPVVAFTGGREAHLV